MEKAQSYVLVVLARLSCPKLCLLTGKGTRPSLKHTYTAGKRRRLESDVPRGIRREQGTRCEESRVLIRKIKQHNLVVKEKAERGKKLKP